jgi:hypothetical protein
MTNALQPVVLALVAAMAVAPAGTRAADKPALEVLSQITLDMDRDGKLDRAAMVHNPQSIYADLYIYLGAGAEPLDLAHKPTFVKKDFTTDPVLGLASDGKGALVVKYGRVGLGSNQYEMRLTVVHRRGGFWVAGFSNDWDMRDGSIGSCDINFLTGKGVASHSNAKPRPIKAKFVPIKLSDWSEDRQLKTCR